MAASDVICHTLKECELVLHADYANPTNVKTFRNKKTIRNQHLNM